MSTLTQRVSALGASTAVAGAALLGGVPMTQLDTTGLFHSVQRDLGLVADHVLLPPVDSTIIPDFDQSLKFLMDGMLGIGGKTLPGLIDPDGQTTLQSLLGASGLYIDADGSNAASTMTDVFNQVGLDGITLGQVLGLLGIDNPDVDTLGQLMDTGGALAGIGGLTMDQLLGVVGPDGTATTISSLVTALGMGDKTIIDLGGSLLSGNMGDMFTNLGIPGLQGFLPLLGMSTTDPVTGLFTTLGMDGTLSTLLGTGGMLSSIGDMTLGKLLGIQDGAMTLGSVLGDMDFDGTKLGDMTMTALLGEVQLDPTESLSAMLGGLEMGLGGATTLGTSSLADFLGLMAGGDTITNATTLTGFLGGAGLDQLTLDDWMGLGTVDISNWFGDPITP